MASEEIELIASLQLRPLEEWGESRRLVVTVNTTREELANEKSRAEVEGMLDQKVEEEVEEFNKNSGEEKEYHPVACTQTVAPKDSKEKEIFEFLASLNNQKPKGD